MSVSNTPNSHFHIVKYARFFGVGEERQEEIEFKSVWQWMIIKHKK